MASRKRARADDFPSSSTPAPPSATIGLDPRAQPSLVRPNEATPPEPTPVRVEPVPADPQSPVVNPPSSLELEVVPHLHL
ncbi:hypothetical protein glysoja_023715 [Glycine soja]|nr:hypothetical protein glysoja_023715 [Glycine soja]